MAAGPLPLGLVVFAAVKFAGYSLAGVQLNRLCRSEKPHPALFGAVRTALGLMGGIGFAALALKVGLADSEPAFYAALAPVRLAEWLLVLYFFYVRSGLARGRWLGYALLASLWSYVLDVPAVLALFAVPGGTWIC